MNTVEIVGGKVWLHQPYARQIRLSVRYFELLTLCKPVTKIVGEFGRLAIHPDDQTEGDMFLAITPMRLDPGKLGPWVRILGEGLVMRIRPEMGQNVIVTLGMS